MVSIRKCLYISMIRNGNRLMSPFHGTFDNILDIGNAVHVAHLGMAMQFHALINARIHTNRCKISTFFYTNNGAYSKFTVKFVNGCDTFDLYKFALIDFS